MNDALRCPACSALVVDRRSPVCTTCHAPLPAEWVLTLEQIRHLEAIDHSARAEHANAMDLLEPDPNSDNLSLRPAEPDEDSTA